MMGTQDNPYIVSFNTLVTGETAETSSSNRYGRVYYKFFTESNKRYLIRFNFPNSDIDAEIEVSNDMSIDYDTYGTGEKVIPFASDNSGWVMIRIGVDSSYDPVIPFTFIIEEQTPQDGDSFERTLPIQLNTTKAFEITPTLANVYFKLNTVIGNTYIFETLGSLDAYAYLYDSNGVEIARDDDSGEGYNPLIQFVATSDVHYIMVRGYRTPSKAEPITAKFSVPDPTKVTGVKILAWSQGIKVGNSIQLTSEVLPSTAINKGVTWISYDTSILTVDANGVITGVNGGSTYVEVRTNEGSFIDRHSVNVHIWDGQGTESHPYLVSNVFELDKIRTLQSSNILYYFKQTKDIDLTGIEWEPIREPNNTLGYKGHYDGNNFKINGLTINKPTTNYIGIFGRISGKVQNVTLTNVNVTGLSFVGAFAGIVYGEMLNCHVSGNINAESRAGGLCGAYYGPKASYCSSHCRIVAPFYSVGGLFGLVIGQPSVVEKCYSNSYVEGWEDIGGLSGSVETCHVRDCYSTGIVNGMSNVGGLIGYCAILGDIGDAMYIERCHVSGSVSGAHDLGGLIGFLITNSTQTARIHTRDCYVLLATLEDSMPTYTNSLPYGDIVGFILSKTSVVENCYIVNDMQFISQRPIASEFTSTSSGTITREQAKLRATYNGWNFSDIWNNVERVSYPTLRPYKPYNIAYAQLESVSLALINFITQQRRG